jgi:hypothetical protein
LFGNKQAEEGALPKAQTLFAAKGVELIDYGARKRAVFAHLRVVE